jgi:hypothetical protein
MNTSVPPCTPHVITVTQVGTYDFASSEVHLARDFRRILKHKLDTYRYLPIQQLLWVECKHGRTYVDDHGYYRDVEQAQKTFPNCTSMMFDFSMIDPTLRCKSKNVHVKLFDKRTMQTSGLHSQDVEFFRDVLFKLFGIFVRQLSPVMIKMQYHVGAQLDLWELCTRMNDDMFSLVTKNLFHSITDSVSASFGQTKYNGTDIALYSARFPSRAIVNAFTTGSVMISSTTEEAIEWAWKVLVRVVENFPTIRPDLCAALELEELTPAAEHPSEPESECCCSKPGGEPGNNPP